MSELLYGAVNTTSEHEKKINFSTIGRLKEKGSELKKQVYKAASRTLISPFERTDMYALSTVLHTVCESIDIAARRINLYNLASMQASMLELSALIVETSIGVNDSVTSLNDLKNAETISGYCQKIKEVEHRANLVYHKALSEIMGEIDSIAFIKYTDILALLEKTTDRCVESTAIIESILIKNA